MKLDVDDEAASALALLDAGGDAQAGLCELLRTLVAGVVDGGAWEAAWVDQACGEGWWDRQAAALQVAWADDEAATDPMDQVEVEAARRRVG